MKSRLEKIFQLLGVAMLFALLTSKAYCLITINYTYGYTYDSSNAAVANGTLWMLVADSNNNNTFAGGFGANQGLATSGDANSAFTSGQTFAVGGSISGDTIFAMGGYDTASFGDVGGTSGSLVALTLGVNGAQTGRKYAFYWFPGAVFTGGPFETISSQVGGIQSNTNDPGLNAMVFPSDGGNVPQGATNTVAGGSFSTASMTAVNLVPEPSSFMLTALGVFGFVLRRRR